MIATTTPTHTAPGLITREFVSRTTANVVEGHLDGFLSVDTTDLRFCNSCMEGTTRSAEDNLYDSEVLCVECYELREWEHEHKPAECGEAPHGAECTRDHDEEERQDRDDYLYHQRIEDQL